MPLGLYCLQDLRSASDAPLFDIKLLMTQSDHEKSEKREGKVLPTFQVVFTGTFIFHSQVITRNSGHFQAHAVVENHWFQPHGLKVMDGRRDVMDGTENPPGKRPEPQIPLGHTLMQICTFKWTGGFAGAQRLWLVWGKGWENLLRGEVLN